MRATSSPRARLAPVLLLVAVGLTAVPAHARWNAGGGTMTGSATQEAPSALDPECASGRLALDAGTKITGVVVNAVGVGDIGDIRVSGFACAGALRLGADGTGPTGSELHCPTLVGTATSVGPVADWQFSGTCLINAYATLVVFDARLATTSGGGGIAFSGLVTVATGIGDLPTAQDLAPLLR